MPTLKEFIIPNPLKIALMLSLLTPIFFVSMFIDILSFHNVIFIVIITLIFSYLIAALLDTFIKSRTVKIIIASILGIVSILILIVIYIYSTTMICDPVHNPSDNVYDPVHSPATSGSSPQEISRSLPSPSSETLEKFKECIHNCHF